MSEPPRASGEIELASEADFQLGAVRVEPSALRLSQGDINTRVEPRVMQVLIVLARAAGRTVSRDHLIDACWGGRIVSDDAVSRIIAKARMAARAFDPSPFTIETTQRVGFRLIAETSTDPVAAPASSSLPEHVEARPTRSVSVPESAARPAGSGVMGVLTYLRRRRVIFGAGLAALAILAIAWLALMRGEPGDPGGTGLVEIMAVQAPQDDLELVELARQMGEEAIRMLPGRVYAPGLPPSATDAGGPASGAEFRITGDLDRSGDQLITKGQIIERASGLVLWTGRVERPRAEVQTAALGFGTFVGGVLMCALDQRDTSRRALSVSELSLVLNVCDGLVFRRRDAVEPANELVRMAPDLALSHALLSAALMNGADGYVTDPNEVAVQTDATGSVGRRARIGAASSAARRALAIMPEHPIAHLTLARIAQRDGQFAEADRHFQAALAFDPDFTPNLATYLGFLSDVGRLQEAAELARRASGMSDPRMIGLSAAIALLQAMSEGPDAAAQALERVRASNPERHDGIAATISIWWGPPDEALKELPTVSDQALPGPIRGCFRLVLNRLAVGARMTGLPGTCSELSTDWRIRLLSRTGQVDEAYALFDASNSADRRANMFLFYPEMKAFRQDARFLPLTRRIGLYAYWQETGKWPDFCEEPDLPYDCRAG